MQRVAIVQDLKDLSVKLVGPGAMARIAEINNSTALTTYSWFYHDTKRGMPYCAARRIAWRKMKLRTQPV